MVLDPIQLAQEFFGAEEITDLKPFGNGHINETFVVHLSDGRQAVVQHVNEHVFPNPVALMNNVERVCRHLGQKYAHLPDHAQRHLSLWPTREGRSYFRDAQGRLWRAYHRVLGVTSFDRLTRPEQAYQVGKAFAEFQAMLSDLPQPSLHDTIPDFHHTPKRVARLLQAIAADKLQRVASAQKEIDFVLERRDQVGRLVDMQTAGLLPERITHNDTKLNNLLFDQAGENALCVVDLDTVMPGLVHYDFGDMIRTATNRGEEDESDLEKVSADATIFSPLVQGYLDGGKAFLTKSEIGELVFSGILITLEVGMRFLTDHLEGDHYFRIHHPDHNLQRCRAQLALVRSLEAQRRDWEALVAGLA